MRSVRTSPRARRHKARGLQAEAGRRQDGGRCIWILISDGRIPATRGRAQYQLSGAELDPLPKAKKACTICGEPIYVRSGPDGKRHLLRAEDMTVIESVGRSLRGD
jgi:hypothetical protein